MIAWKLWSDRNHCLHETDQGIEIQEINKVLTEEYKSGLGTLPSQYSHLFCSTLATLLSHDHFIKQKRLASIWSARERHSDSQLHCEPEAQHNNFFQRWRHCADPQRAIAERRVLQRQTRHSWRAQGALTDKQTGRSRADMHHSSSSESDSEPDWGLHENFLYILICSPDRHKKNVIWSRFPKPIGLMSFRWLGLMPIIEDNWKGTASSYTIKL